MVCDAIRSSRLVITVDPSAAVNADYYLRIVAATNGRVFHEIIVSRTDIDITLKSQHEAIVLDHSKIDEIQQLTQSSMPQGLLESSNGKRCAPSNYIIDAVKSGSTDC